MKPSGRAFRFGTDSHGSVIEEVLKHAVGFSSKRKFKDFVNCEIAGSKH